MKYFFILLVWTVLFITNAQTPMINQNTVTNFELTRYLGTWYEIARFDHPFERGLEGVTATYSLKENGKIKVLNSGYKTKKTRKLSEATGKAKVPDPNTPSKLKVSFFLFFYADYYVLELDKDYQWSVVGSSSNDYLWILARKPFLSDATYNDLLERITARGYNTDKLINVKHNIDDYVEQ